MRPVKKDLAPVVKSILSDVQCSPFGGIRIPKDKFMMWISILRKQHKGNESVFLQLAVLGVEFVRQKVSFVSDQFFILAAVGLDAVRIGALLAPEDVETKVASMFIQKFQSTTGSMGLGAVLAPSPHNRTQIINRPTLARRATENAASLEVTLSQVRVPKERPTGITQTNAMPGMQPAPSSSSAPKSERTVIEPSYSAGSKNNNK